MKNLLKNRKIIAGVVIVVIALFLYNFLSGADPSVPADSGLGLPASTANDDLLKIATELSAVDYQTELFSTPGYILLTDFSLPLTPQPVGRPNPFNIIGRD